MTHGGRILLVAQNSPWGERSGGQQRISLLWQALQKLRSVDMLVLDEGRENRAVAGERPEILAQLTWQESPLTLDKFGTNRFVARWCDERLDWNAYALVVGHMLRAMTKIAYPSHLRTILDCDNALYRYAPASHALASHAMAPMRTFVRHWQTRAVASRYDHVFYASPRERFMLDARKCSLLPNVVRSVGALPAALDVVPTVLCVGTMWYPPNRDGIEWFLKRCWPRVADRCPGLALRIVGAAPRPMRARWEQSVRTEAPGPVDDLRSEYARALFAVAPIRFGGGTQIKFLESAAYARACVATRFVVSAFGDDFRDGEATLIADDATEMVEQCIELANDAPRRDAIASRAQQIVAQRYTVERFEAGVHEAVQRLLHSPAEPVPRASDSASRLT